MNFHLKKALFLFKSFDTIRQNFYEDFSIALADGASDIDRLKKLAKRGRVRKSVLTPLYELWIHRMKRQTFANALVNTIPEHESMILTAAEEEARLADGMSFLVRSIKFTSAIKTAFFMSLISPVLGLIMIIAFFVLYAVLIAPIYLQTIPLNRWPLSSKMIYYLSTSIVNGWHTSLFVLIGIIALIVWSRPNWKGGVRSKIEKLPLLPWKSYKHRKSIDFLVTLAVLMQGNNHGLKEALQKMRVLSNPWQAWHITMMIKRLAMTPNYPARALDTGFFERSLMDRIEDYSESSEFYVGIFKLAFDQGDQFVKKEEKKAILSGFVALLVVASILIFFVFANYEMSQAIESTVSNIR